MATGFNSAPLPVSSVLRPIQTCTTEGEDLDRPAPAGAMLNGAVLAGTGALHGQQISVPESSDPPEPVDASRLPPQVQHALLQPDEDLQRQMDAQLQPLPDQTPLYVPKPLSLATNARVIDMLEAHALAAGSKLHRSEIVAYVALGERALEQIRASTPMPTRGAVTPNLEAMRGISWYVVACAAQQDVNREADGLRNQIGGQAITDLTISGSYVFKDPDNAVYDFMNSYPPLYSRISTHFNERSLSSGSSSGQADQRGIEDYQSRLPGENGTILFDKLTQGEIFFKFESAGMPTAASAGMVDNQKQGGASWFQVGQRVFNHAASFIWTRFYPTPGVERKEHVYKGLLETEVYQPFLQIMVMAQAHGLLKEGATLALHKKQSQEEGLPHLEKTLAQIKEQINEQIGMGSEQTAALTELLLNLTALEAAIQNSKEQLGAQSNHLGIIRRGAETHVDLNPPSAYLKQASDGFSRLEGDAARPQGVQQSTGVHAETAQDWSRHNGITINGVTYPGSQAGTGIAPGIEGRESTLQQAQRALVDLCGNNAVAADWISRFARQAQAAPLVEYLRKESMGTLGSDLELIGAKGTFAIEKKGDGVELRWDLLYQKEGDAPLQITTGDKMLHTMQDDATLKASMILRFEGLDTFVAGRAPAPTILQPLVYSTSNFHLSIEDQFEVIDPDSDESPVP